MDGLTVSTARDILQTGRTTSELSQLKNGAKPAIAESSVVGKSFAETLNESIGKVNDLQKEADVLMQKLATGESKNIPEVMVAAEKADIALKLMVQVRNKVIDAYQEIMKMQV